MFNKYKIQLNNKTDSFETHRYETKLTVES